MLEAVINLLEKYSSQLLFLQIGLAIILSGIFVWIYFYNRKKYQNFKHQIPSSVVKNYLDSIIHNSNSLKSSLFRGGGEDVDTSNLPSIKPVDSLATGGASAAGGADNSALLAQISALQNELANSKQKNTELENEINSKKSIISERDTKIKELEDIIEKLKAGAADGGGAVDAAVQAELDSVKKERDEMKERLAQYEVLEDDLANLKSLKEENKKLKEQLGMGGDEPPAAAEPAEEPAPVEEPVAEEPVAEEPVAEEPAEEVPAAEEVLAEADVSEIAEGMAEAEEPKQKGSDDQSADDLLSEFEKMLG